MERIPIFKMGPYLLVTIQVDMHDRVAMTLQDELTERIVSERARGVLLDISSVDVVDSFIGRMIGNIASMSRVLDAETVVVGMRPGGGHHASGIGFGVAEHQDRPQRGCRHGAAEVGRKDVGEWPSCAMS